MIGKTIRLTAVCLILICVLPAIAGAQSKPLPLTSQVPAAAVLYFGWAGADDLASAYQASDMSALIDHSNLPELAKEYAPRLWEQLAGQADNPQATAALRKALQLLWRHPAAIYLTTIAVSQTQVPGGDATLICDAGADAPDLRDDLSAIVKDNDRLHVSMRDFVVMLGVGEPGKTPTSTLADVPRFIAAMKLLRSATPAITIYVDAKSLLQQANESAAADADASAAWPKIRDALGLTDVKSFAMTAGFEGSKWMTASLIDAPAPRKGVLAAIEPKPLDPALLARIPAMAGSISVYNFDAILMFDLIGQAMAATKQTDTMFHQMSGIASLVLGRNFRRQILPALGSQWVVYADPSTKGPVLLNHPVNAHAASDVIESAMFGLMGIANAQAPGAVVADQRRVKGIDLTSAVTSTLSPTYAVNDKILYFGLTPDSVVAAALRPSIDGNNDALHDPGFMTAEKQLETSDLVSFDYCDIPGLAPAAVANYPAIGKQFQSMFNNFGVTIPSIELPPMEQLTSHLCPLFAGSWVDANAVYSRSISPFPGSGLLLGDPQQSMTCVSAITAIAALAPPAMQMMRDRGNPR